MSGLFYYCALTEGKTREKDINAKRKTGIETLPPKHENTKREEQEIGTLKRMIKLICTDCF